MGAISEGHFEGKGSIPVKVVILRRMKELREQFVKG